MALRTFSSDTRSGDSIILGFPSNDFAGQEPGSDADIQEFCRINHGVTFPLFAKASVKGPEQQELFRILTTQGPKDLRGTIKCEL